MKTSLNPHDGKQYWLDLVGWLTEAGMAVTPLESARCEFGGLEPDHLRLMTELLIPYHTPDGKKYGFTVYILNKPNSIPAFEEMHALMEMAPRIAGAYGHLCKEVCVDD